MRPAQTLFVILIIIAVFNVDPYPISLPSAKLDLFLGTLYTFFAEEKYKIGQTDTISVKISHTREAQMP